MVDLATVLAKYCGSLKLHVIHFTDIQMEIRKTCREDYTITMMRRFMYRIAERIARSRNCHALYRGVRGAGGQSNVGKYGGHQRSHPYAGIAPALRVRQGEYHRDCPKDWYL